MAKKPKPRKMRKKPKASASVESKSQWIKDKIELDKDNASALKTWKDNKKKSKELSSKIKGM